MNRRDFFQTAAASLLLWLPIVVQAEDWPQWRGPNRLRLGIREGDNGSHSASPSATTQEGRGEG